MTSTNKISYTHRLASLSATPKVIKSHSLWFEQFISNIFSHPISLNILIGVLICIIRWRILISFRLDASRGLLSPCGYFSIMTMTIISNTLIACLWTGRSLICTVTLLKKCLSWKILSCRFIHSLQESYTECNLSFSTLVSLANIRPPSCHECY